MLLIFIFLLGLLPTAAAATQPARPQPAYARTAQPRQVITPQVSKVIVASLGLAGCLLVGYRLLGTQPPQQPLIPAPAPARDPSKNPGLESQTPQPQVSAQLDPSTNSATACEDKKHTLDPSAALSVPSGAASSGTNTPIPVQGTHPTRPRPEHVRCRCLTPSACLVGKNLVRSQSPNNAFKPSDANYPKCLPYGIPNLKLKTCHISTALHLLYCMSEFVWSDKYKSADEQTQKVQTALRKFHENSTTSGIDEQKVENLIRTLRALGGPLENPYQWEDASLDLLQIISCLYLPFLERNIYCREEYELIGTTPIWIYRDFDSPDLMLQITIDWNKRQSISLQELVKKELIEHYTPIKQFQVVPKVEGAEVVEVPDPFSLYAYLKTHKAEKDNPEIEEIDPQLLESISLYVLCKARKFKWAEDPPIEVGSAPNALPGCDFVIQDLISLEKLEWAIVFKLRAADTSQNMATSAWLGALQQELGIYLEKENKWKLHNEETINTLLKEEYGLNLSNIYVELTQQEGEFDEPIWIMRPIVDFSETYYGRSCSYYPHPYVVMKLRDPNNLNPDPPRSHQSTLTNIHKLCLPASLQEAEGDKDKPEQYTACFDLIAVGSQVGGCHWVAYDRGEKDNWTKYNDTCVQTHQPAGGWDEELGKGVIFVYKRVK